MQVHRTYQLAKYNPNWPKLFTQKAGILRPIFGDNAISIEHIGSTSIPGISAKPQIDIMIEVTERSGVKQVYESMKSAGFMPRGDYGGLLVGEEYFSEDAPNGKRLSSVHVYETGDPKIARNRNFRDYLRAHSGEMQEYETAKSKLYEMHKDDYPAYNRAKVAIIDGINARASEWAKLAE